MTPPDRLRAVPVLALILTAAVAGAPGGAGAGYYVTGAVECPDVISQDGHDGYRLANMWWILGYFTGRNYEREDNAGRGVEAEELYARVLEFCRRNPEKDMDDASIEVYDALR